MSTRGILTILDLGTNNYIREMGFRLKTNAPLYKLKETVAKKVDLPLDILYFETEGEN